MERPATEIQDFDKVVQLYWAPVFRFIFISLRDSDAAETLTQDCFWKAYRSRRLFRGDSSVKTWLMQIALNLIRDFSRNRRLQFWRRTRATSLEVTSIVEWMPNGETSPESRALLKEQVNAVWEATEVLSEKQRIVFLLRFVEDMDLLEIAATTGLKIGAVKVHLFRALQTIRKRIRSS